MVCSALSRASEDEADGEGHPGDCHTRWSAAKTYLVHVVSWLQVYKQVLCPSERPCVPARVQARHLHPTPPTSSSG